MQMLYTFTNTQYKRTKWKTNRRVTISSENRMLLICSVVHFSNISISCFVLFLAALFFLLPFDFNTFNSIQFTVHIYNTYLYKDCFFLAFTVYGFGEIAKFCSQTIFVAVVVGIIHIYAAYIYVLRILPRYFLASFSG